MPTGLEATAGLLAVVASGILADAVRPNGKLRSAIEAALRKRQTAEDAHAVIPEVKDTLEHVAEKQDLTLDKLDNVASKTDRNAFLIEQFHGDDDVTVPVNDVLDDDSDFLRKPDE